MNNKTNIWLPLVLALVLVLGMFLGDKYAGVSGKKNVPKSGNAAADLNYIMNYIKNDYVDTVNADKIYQKSIDNILGGLDPFSVYISPDDIRQASEPLEGNFEGIGIEFYQLHDTILVVNTIEGGPSDKVGIRAGDRIVQVNNKNIGGVKMSSEAVIKLLKGAKNSEVLLGVVRQSSGKKVVNYKVIRGNVPIYSIDAAIMLSSNVGYVKLNSFSATTADEMQTAIMSLKKQGMTKLMLDLRNNGGGYLDAAIAVADEFLGNDALVTYTQGRNQPKKEYKATNYGNFEDNSVAILIDEGSASASEILAGAMQDWDRATIVGRRSFGKGLVQEQYQMPSGGALRLTVARYHTPTGRCIQKPYADNLNMRNGSYLQAHQGELFSLDSIKKNDKLRYKTKNGRTVYGGGGIIPDVFVPVDSSKFGAFFGDVFAQGVLLDYAYQYADSKQDLLQIYRNSQNFATNFQLSAQDYQNFMNFARKQGIKSQPKPGEETIVKNYIKAYIGKRSFDENALYATIFATDQTAIKALQILNSKSSSAVAYQK